MSRYRAGYDSRPQLVAPTVSQGAAQRLASGTTSATVTVAAATGGGGVYTYSAPAIDKPQGAPAAVSGTVPGALSVTGLADGQSVVVSGTATDGTGQAVAWSHVVAVAAAGGGGGGGGPVDVLDLDLEDLTTAAAMTSGQHTLEFESSDTQLTVDVGRFSGHNGDVTPTNGQGLVFNGGDDTNSRLTLSTIISGLFSSYTYDDAREYRYTVHMFLNSIAHHSAGQSGLQAGVQRGSTWQHNSGIARYALITSHSDGLQEEIRVRRNTSSSAVIDTYAKRATRVISATVNAGEIVSVQDTAGSTAPTPAIHGAGVHFVGSDAVGLNATAAAYQSSGLRALLSSVSGGSFRCSRILVQRW